MDLFDLSAKPELASLKVSCPSRSLDVEPFVETASNTPSVELLPGYEAAASEETVRRISQIFNESFGYRPDGRPYRLGPKSVTERLLQTD